MMNKELDFIQGMFDTIAPKYDFLNRLLSLRQDVYWRREMVSAARIHDNAPVLDVACGTCDVIVEIFRQKRKRCRIFGIDFSFKMLLLGREKTDKACGKETVNLLSGDALHLPFRENVFDAVFIAFGIRNIVDRKKALRSFHRCLKKGGRVVILELTTPGPGVLQDLYILYFKKILPFIGGIVSKNARAYSYLPNSVIQFPGSAAFASLMKGAGYKSVKYRKMTLGIVTLFVGVKK